MNIPYKEMQEYQAFSIHIISELGIILTDGYPALEFVPRFADTRPILGKYHHGSDIPIEDERVYIAYETCLEQNISVKMAIAHELRHVWQWQQPELANLLPFWDAYSKRHKKTSAFYNYAAHELDARAFSRWLDEKQRYTIFDMFLPLQRLEQLSDGDIFLYSYDAFCRLRTLGIL